MRNIIDRQFSKIDIKTIIEQAEKAPKLFVEQSESYYNNQIELAADMITQRMPKNKFILLSGPSASGKTTTAFKLCERLQKKSIGAQVISMDDFFIGISRYPLLQSGNPDMESIKALDIKHLNHCFDQLLSGGSAELPLFDFNSQQRSDKTRKVSISQGDVLIMEGIHALNPNVLSNIPQENIFKIYASVRTVFVSGEEEVLAPKDIRLIRRMVRDSIFRNYPPIKTLRQWAHVLEAEHFNINPYRDRVDLKMDNTIDYEVCVWKEMLSSHLTQEEYGEYEKFPEIKRILQGLERFSAIDHSLIAKNSLLREFISL